MFARLPIEIIEHILELVTRNDINQVCKTCKSNYYKSLPILYRHLELGYYSHIKQLQQGIVVNDFLKQVIQQHTKQLTLRSRQNSNHWRTHDLISILGPQPKIRTIRFCDFRALSTDLIHRTVSVMPQVYSVEYHYCHIVYQTTTRTLDTADSTFHTSQVKHVMLQWTDFTKKCIPFMLFKNLIRLELGSNRNKYDGVNEMLVDTIYQQCPALTHMIITLPQVSCSVLCRTIAKYGTQLQHLSIKCDSTSTLQAVAANATELQSLCVRATSDHCRLDYALLDILYMCPQLKWVEVKSQGLEKHVHDIVWQVLGGNEAQEMLSKRKQAEENGEPERPVHVSAAGNIWFYTVSEEALRSRSNYLHSMRGYKKQEAFKSIMLHQRDILKIKSRLNSC